MQLAANDTGFARVGFALVGVRSAVRRNRLRRRLRETVRPLLSQLAGRDLVIVAGAEAAGAPFGELRSSVQVSVFRVLERAESAAVGSTADNGSMTRPPEEER